MRRIRYLVATSLDGFIAGPNGEADWIEPDFEVDFPALWAQFDTGLMDGVPTKQRSSGWEKRLSWGSQPSCSRAR